MLRTLAVLALIGLLAGCMPKPVPEDPMPEAPAETPAPADLISGEGTITYFDLEGGFYGLIADDGSRYDPLGLDEAFRQDGLRVRFRARPRTGVMTIRQWGKPVEILEIAQIDKK